jgi:hypothetical protein
MQDKKIFKQEIAYFSKFILIDSIIFILSVSVIFLWSASLQNGRIADAGIPFYCVISFLICGLSFILGFLPLFKNAYPYLFFINIYRYISVLTKFIIIQFVFTFNHFFGFFAVSYPIFAALICIDFVVSYLIFQKLSRLNEQDIIEVYQNKNYDLIKNNYDNIKKFFAASKKAAFTYIFFVVIFSVAYDYFAYYFLIWVFLAFQAFALFFFLRGFWKFVFCNLKKQAIIAVVIFIFLSLAMAIVAIVYKDMKSSETQYLIILPLVSISNITSKIFGDYFAYNTYKDKLSNNTEK